MEVTSDTGGRSPEESKPYLSPIEVLHWAGEQCGSRDRAMSFSSFSPSLYDTAWLSMVPTEDNPDCFLFPQCLNIVLQVQQPDGTWPCYASLADGITSSLAALLSLTTHRALSLPSSEEHQTLNSRCETGIAGLCHLLEIWDVDLCENVGFELLITSLLRQLEERLATRLEFPKRKRLEHLYEKKITKFSPAMVCGPKKTTVLHSIEAFVGKIQFEDVSHHCTEELGIFGSPAATAAYLINAPKWDHRAEKYLRKCVNSCENTGNVPSAFPTPLFELSWTISTLLSPITQLPSLSGVNLETVAAFFAETLQNQNGLVGFAPGILEDADDTARNLLTILRLRRIGYPNTTDLAPMLSKFEGDECFKTYELEQNPSFSANCNVAIVMLELEPEAVDQYAPQIEKALNYLLGRVQMGDRNIVDKWNTSSEYSYMLLVEVLVLALKRNSAGCLQTIPQDNFTQRIPLILCRVLSQILAAQQNDGSWKNSLEVTSYSILAVSHALRLPWCTSIREHLTAQVKNAQNFLRTSFSAAFSGQNDYIWIEKTTYQSYLLRIAYCSMAIHAVPPLEEWSNSVTSTFAHFGDGDQSKKYKKLFSLLPLLNGVPLAMLEMALLESKFHVSNLANKRNLISPRSELPLGQDKYLAYIPIVWLLGNQLNGQALSANMIDDMLKLSHLTYQIDELMETAVNGLSDTQTNELESWVQAECEMNYTNGEKTALAIDDSLANGDYQYNNSNGSMGLVSIKSGLRCFIQYIMRHNAVLESSLVVQRFLAIDLGEYLLAHMRQNKDNSQLRTQKVTAANTRLRSYFSWARSTGADHTSCPLAFRFFMCLVSRTHCYFESAQSQYYSASVGRHLATMCRQYNDYGSIARDAEEDNLNSINFAEFQIGAWERDTTRSGLGHCDNHSSKKPSPFDDLSSAKESLMAIAQFERQLMTTSLDALGKVVDSPEALKAVKVLVDVTDLFGQLYVAKDISSRKQATKTMTSASEPATVQKQSIKF